MKVIIDISKDVYEECQGHIYFPDTGGELFNAVKNGTPLSKGYGRLIDADKLKNDAQTMTEWNGDVFRCVTERTIDLAPTIIEADRESEDKG